MQKITIAVVIITFNEAKNIERCLQSVQSFADEIIVVDSFSTDETKAICDTYKVRFFERKFIGYADQKNWGNTQTTSDFIFSLDADEVPSEQLLKSILSIQNKPKSNVYRFNRLTNFCGTWIRFAGWYPDKKIRIWRKGSADWFGKEVHEIVQVKQGEKVQHLKGDLLHYSFDSIEDYLRRQNKYAKLSVAEKLKHGKQFKFLPSLVKFFYKFFLLYFLKLGFFHAYHGFVVCINGAGKYLINYAKFLELENEKLIINKVIDTDLDININKYSHWNIFKIRKWTKLFKTNKVTELVITKNSNVKFLGIVAFWSGISSIIYKGVLPKGNDLLILFLKTDVLRR
jgi:glycosyltransferase involved in cell wall biosynthesis